MGGLEGLIYFFYGVRVVSTDVFNSKELIGQKVSVYIVIFLMVSTYILHQLGG